MRDKVEEIRASASRMAHEGIWMTNIAYLLGVDGVTFNTSTRQYQPINRAGSAIKKNRVHVNRILPTVQNRLARLCKNPPKYDVRPESNDTEDREAARLSLQVLGCLWEKLSLNEKRLWLYMWVQQAGHGWVKVAWDPLEGKPMPDLGEGGIAGYEGEVAATVESPFEIFPNPEAKTPEEVFKTWLIQCKVRKLDYFKERYPEKGELVKEEECWLLSAQYAQKINSMNARAGQSGSPQDFMKNSAIEMVKYEARSKDYPNGRMIVTANGVLLEDKELPVGEIPFAMFHDVIVAGKLYSEAIITHLRPTQDQYNETVRRRAEWTKRLLAGKYKAPRGSGITQEQLTDESSEVVYYTPVPNEPGGVEALQIPTIPQYAYTEEEQLKGQFNDISGISEVSRGQMPSASIPAIGMQLLTEQDDTRIGVMTEQHEHAWARVGSLILKHVEKFYELPRKLKIAGKSLQYTVKEVSGADIRGNTDVIVIRGSTLPGSKTLKRQEIINLHQDGYLGNPQDPKVLEKVLGMLEYGDVGEAWQDFGLDMSQIQKGIDNMEKGQPVQHDDLSELENHALWLQEIGRYRKGDKWDSLADPIKNLFIEEYKYRMQEVLRLSNSPLPPPQDDMQQLDQAEPGSPDAGMMPGIPSPQPTQPQPGMPMPGGQ